MKKFDIITESDARALTRGETVVLAHRGHVTPLAQDTLNERRIVVLAEDSLSVDAASLVPEANPRAIALRLAWLCSSVTRGFNRATTRKLWLPRAFNSDADPCGIQISVRESGNLKLGGITPTTV